MSSNVYANGSNQNSGNVITDRSTTRIHHAPGGASSICLGDGSADTRFTDKPGRQAGYGSSRQPEANGRQPCYGLSQRPEPAPQQQQQQQPEARAMTPQQQYAADLKAQIDAKKALAGAGKAAHLQADRADDARVQRESGQLRAEHDGEIAKQRQREANAEQNTQRHAEYMARESGLVQGQQRGNHESPWPEANNESRHRTNVPAEQNSSAISANRYASGANQNSGNVMTDRSTTRIHQAPGGKSSLVLG